MEKLQTGPIYVLDPDIEKIETEKNILISGWIKGCIKVKGYFPDVVICHTETRFIQNSMIPRVIIDFVYKDKLKTLTIYLDKEKADAFDIEYIESTIINSIEKYIIQFDKNNKKQ